MGKYRVNVGSLKSGAKERVLTWSTCFDRPEFMELIKSDEKLDLAAGEMTTLVYGLSFVELYIAILALDVDRVVVVESAELGEKIKGFVDLRKSLETKLNTILEDHEPIRKYLESIDTVE